MTAQDDRKTRRALWFAVAAIAVCGLVAIVYSNRHPVNPATENVAQAPAAATAMR